MKKEVSVILPVYNGEKYIPAALESLSHSTFSNYELVIIDDGSTDSSRKLILKYMHNHPIDFHLIMKTNQGVSQARNDGIQAAKGKYLVFIDVDDTIEPDYLEKLVKGMYENDNDIVMCSYRRKNESNLAIEQIQFATASVNQDTFLNLILPRHTALWNKIFKREIILSNQLSFDASLAIGEDFDFLTDYLLKCKKIKIIEDSLYTYHLQNNGAMHQQINPKKMTEWEAICKVEGKLMDHPSVFSKLQYKKCICAHKLIQQCRGKAEYNQQRIQMLCYLRSNRLSIISNPNIPFKFKIRLIQLTFQK